MSIEDAFKVIISGGIVSPDTRAMTTPPMPKRSLDSYIEQGRPAIVLEEEV